MSEYLMDSGHHYMQTCDDCDGAFHTGKRPKREDQTDAPDFTCKHCQQQAAEIARLTAALAEERERRERNEGALVEERDDARAALARLTLSGQVAEDEAALVDVLKQRAYGADCVPNQERVARLAAKAQEYEAAVADNAGLWRVVNLLAPAMAVLSRAPEVAPEIRTELAGAERIFLAGGRRPGAALLKELEEARDLGDFHRKRAEKFRGISMRLNVRAIDAEKQNDALLKERQEREETIKALVEVVVYAERSLELGTIAARDAVTVKIAKLRTAGVLP